MKQNRRHHPRSLSSVKALNANLFIIDWIYSSDYRGSTVHWTFRAWWIPDNRQV